MSFNFQNGKSNVYSCNNVIHYSKTIEDNYQHANLYQKRITNDTCTNVIASSIESKFPLISLPFKVQGMTQKMRKQQRLIQMQ